MHSFQGFPYILYSLLCSLLYPFPPLTPLFSYFDRYAMFPEGPCLGELMNTVDREVATLSSTQVGSRRDANGMGTNYLYGVKEKCDSGSP